MKKNMRKQPAIFLDRDGTLVEEVNYLSTPEDLRLFHYSGSAVKLFKESGFLVFVVTNQSGIGRGIFDEAAMNSIHEEIQQQLSGAIDAFYFCPHLPCDGCRCRKPGPGMIEAASADFAIDLKNSWMIGDKKIDVETGINVGVKTAFVLTGYGQRHRASLERQPDLIANDLGEAAFSIFQISKQA